MKSNVIKLHFKKAKPKYYKFFMKKKKTKNGRVRFYKKKVIINIKIITFDMVASPSLTSSQIKMVNNSSKKLQEKFPDHKVFQVRGLIDGEVYDIIRGVDVE